jgi:hypothetical protein
MTIDDLIRTRTGWPPAEFALTLPPAAADEIREHIDVALVEVEAAAVAGLVMEVSGERIDQYRQNGFQHDDERQRRTRRNAQQPALQPDADEDAADTAARLQRVIDHLRDRFGSEARWPVTEADSELSEDFFQEVGATNKATYASIMHLIIAVVTLLYTASVFSTSSEVVEPLMSTLSTWAALSATAQLFESAMAGVHSMRIRLPVSRRVLGCRVLMWALSAGLLATSSAVVAGLLFAQTEPLSGATTRGTYVSQVQAAPDAVCTYCKANFGAGWDTPCTLANWSSALCPAPCAATIVHYTTACRGVVHSQLEGVLGPLAAIHLCAVAVHLFDLYALGRFLALARMLMA